MPKEWLRTVGVDFGGTEHTCLVWLAQDPSTNFWYAFREALGGGLTGAEHARAATQYAEAVRLAAGGARSEDDSRRTWAMAGFPVSEPLIYDVEDGILRVVGLLKERRLFVMDTLTGLRSELGTYSREVDAAGMPLLKIEDKEKFHRLDALRYACSHIPLAHKEPVTPEDEEAKRRGRTIAAIREHAKLVRPEEEGPGSLYG